MARQRVAVTETSPLLQPDEEEAPNCSGVNKIDSHGSLQRHWSHWSALYLCAALVLLLDIPGFMSEAPKLRMLEMGICREYYAANGGYNQTMDGRDIPEELCKIPKIQSSLATMRGFLETFEALAGLILAVPYGILADKKGRRLVTGLCLIGFILRELWTFVVLYFHQVFSVKAVYAAPAMLIIGGGSTVVSPMILAILAASISAESRTRAFFWYQVAFLTTELVAPPLSSALMEALGPHLAFLVGIPFIASDFIVLAFLPHKVETRPESGEIDSSNNPGNVQSSGPTSLRGKLRRAAARIMHYIRVDLVTIISKRPLLIGLSALVVAKITRPMLALTLQFMSVKFDWPIRKTAFLLSIQAAAQIPLYTIILPAANGWLLRRRSVALANLTIARVSVLLMALGALLMGLAPVSPAFICAMVVQTAGSGYASALRSLLTSLISEDQISLLYTSMAVFESVAVMCAAPALQLLFSWGIQAGGTFLSSPYYLAASIYASAGVALSLGFRLSKA